MADGEGGLTVVTEASASRLGKPVAGPMSKKSPSVASQEVDDASGQYMDRFRRKYPDKDMGYTDKDRAAAMAAGSRDIKVSLQVKKKREKSHDEPEQKEFRIRLAMAEHNVLTANYERALHFIDKALSFKAEDRECTVVRARCYLGLGLNEKALQDADLALSQDKRYAKAIHIKAETLYTLGRFEHSLVYYHRGQKLRPDMEVFRLGIQKAQEAIENAIGENAKEPVATDALQQNVAKPDAPHWADYTDSSNSRECSAASASKQTKSAKSLRGTAGGNQSGQLMSELLPDIEYLQKLANSPSLTKLNSPACRVVRKEARDALRFLKSRKDFWMQQRPYTWSESRSRTAHLDDFTPPRGTLDRNGPDRKAFGELNPQDTN